MEGFDRCPGCQQQIELRRELPEPSFTCPACGCRFRHNWRKWLLGLPFALLLALLLLYFTRDTFIPPVFLAFVAVPSIAALVLWRIPSYVVVRSSDATSKA